MEKAYKVCPGCAGEYLPNMEVCGDCGVPLVWEGEVRDPSGGPELVLPPSEGLVVLREAELAWAIGLGKALARAGIPHRLDPGAPAASALRWAVSVGQADAARARALDVDYARTQLPGLEASSDQVCAAAETDACPACGEAVLGDAAECPECGLVFGPVQ